MTTFWTFTKLNKDITVTIANRLSQNLINLKFISDQDSFWLSHLSRQWHYLFSCFRTGLSLRSSVGKCPYRGVSGIDKSLSILLCPDHIWYPRFSPACPRNGLSLLRASLFCQALSCGNCSENRIPSVDRALPVALSHSGTVSHQSGGLHFPMCLYPHSQF